MTELFQRSSGILAHITSLPGADGSGDLGAAAHQFLDFLARAQQRWWQTLPVVIPGSGNSPYDSCSAFAGSPWLLNLDALVQRGWLSAAEREAPSFVKGRVQYARVQKHRARALELAFERFSRQRGAKAKLARFSAAHTEWLPDFALFRALLSAHRGQGWWSWEPALQRRKPAALQRARATLSQEIEREVFYQWLFDEQWRSLRKAARRRGIRLMGDVPMFVAHNSAEVWSHRELFHLDARGQLLATAGAPPDSFNPAGQVWGCPLYRWKRHQQSDFAWWKARLDRMLQLFDAVRIDHFIGLSRTFQIPRGATTAVDGRYRRSPGAELLASARDHLGGLPFIAEDLGAMTDQVRELRDDYDLLGMKVLQFGFDTPDGEYLPHNYPERSVVVTGTHDTDTLVGWYKSLRRGHPDRQKRVLDYLGCKDKEAHWALLRCAFGSVAQLAITPLQDALGLDSRARMNVPGTLSGNWEWRVTPDALTPDLADRVGALTNTYGRARHIR